jgi:hypothetical protein
LRSVGSAASWLAESLSVLRLDTGRMASTVAAAVDTMLGGARPDPGEAGAQVDAALADHRRLTEGER